MNLQALYDLKERLEYAAIAGTGLMQEDFRLRRAVEALAPLAGVNPVFARISAAAGALLKAPGEERGRRLLDVLSLVDAVVYTQGVSNIAGEMIPAEPGTGSYVQVSYGQLQPLLAALGGSGSGRTALIRKCWEEHPAYFRDFRVLPRVVKALGDSYGEVAELAATILSAQGAEVVPLLKSGFDPAGKAEMARRVRLIGALAGEGENDWFIGVLPDCQKDVREAVIQVLGLCRGNVQLLLDLCRSERGKLKEAAMRSLAMMDDDRAAAFWQEEVRKKPACVTCLEGVGSPLAGDLAADALREFFEKLTGGGNTYDSHTFEEMTKLLEVACGKYSEKLRAFWLDIPEQMDRLDEIRPDGSVHFCDLSAAEHLQRCMLKTVLRNPSGQILELAGSLCDRGRKWFLCCRFLGDLAVCAPEAVYTAYAAGIVPTGLLRKETRQQENERNQLMMGFAPLRWEDGAGAFCLAYMSKDPLGGALRTQLRPIAGLDPRWAELLADHSISQEAAVYDLGDNGYPGKIRTGTEFILMQLVDPGNSRVCEVCGTYFYKRAKMTGKLSAYSGVLLRCGWKNWKGLPAHCALKENQVSYAEMMELLLRLPVTNGEKAAEMKQLNELVRTGRVSVRGRVWPGDQIKMMIAQLESDPDSVTLQGGN